LLADLIEKYAAIIDIDNFSETPDKYLIEKSENNSILSEKAIDKTEVA